MFPFSFDLSAVAAVWDRDDNAARVNMQVLVNGSLVEFNAANGRFLLHDFIASICYRKLNLNETRTMEAQLRYAHIFLRFAKQAAVALLPKGYNDTLARIQLFDQSACI